MTRTSKLSDEMIRQKVSWAEQIAKADPDYRDYAGASETDGRKLAKIDVHLKILPKNHPLTTLLKFKRMALIQQAKAYFATTNTGELSQLGFKKESRGRGINAKFKHEQSKQS